MSKFTGLFKDSDDNGKLSTTRVIFLCWSVVVLIFWTCLSWKNRDLQEIPASVVTVLGLLAGGKTIQKFGEMRVK